MENKNLEETDVNEKQKARNGKSAMPMRTCLVMILAGGYVAYLGVSLCQNVINGAEAAAWLMVAGVIFIVLGVAFVINWNPLASIKAGKIQKESNAESEAQASETENFKDSLKSKMESTSSLNKKMSIADRANLVSQLGDATEDEE